jgi:acetyl esterase/lipase
MKHLAGLPPAWIGVGTADLFHDEDATYARRLKESGVECDLCISPGAFHGFDVVAPDAPITKRFRQAQLEALKKHLFVARTGGDERATPSCG